MRFTTLFLWFLFCFLLTCRWYVKLSSTDQWCAFKVSDLMSFTQTSTPAIYEPPKSFFCRKSLMLLFQRRTNRGLEQISPPCSPTEKRNKRMIWLPSAGDENWLGKMPNKERWYKFWQQWIHVASLFSPLVFLSKVLVGEEDPMLVFQPTTRCNGNYPFKTYQQHRSVALQVFQKDYCLLLVGLASNSDEDINRTKWKHWIR